jgi:hypothetical protein
MAGRYDTRELQRVVAVSFSAGELSKFAERWHVHLDREGSATDGARVLLKAVEGRGKLAELLASLRAEKPLVEWPDPPERPEVPPPPPPPEPTPQPTPAPSPAPVSEPAGILADPFDEPPPPERAGLGPGARWAVLAGVLAVGAGIGAAVVLLSAGDDAPAADAGPATVALAAASQLRTSLEALAEACSVEAEDATSARDLLTVSFRRCPQLPPVRGTARPPDPLPARDPPPELPIPGGPPRPPSSEPVCLDRCHTLHESCRQSECGDEPASANKYEAYQRCLQGCMNKYARCRLACR